MNYVTATASNGSRLDLLWERHGHQRPWNKSLRLTVEGGFLREGDTITVIYGDTSGGSPGFRLRTFCESGFVFRVAADPCATGQFMALTTGKFGGFDVWLDPSRDGAVEIETGHVSGTVPLAGIGLDDVVLDAGGLNRAIRICRLPGRLTAMEMRTTVAVPLAQGRDNPVWIRVTTEDGCNAWSSPIYVERQ